MTIAFDLAAGRPPSGGMRMSYDEFLDATFDHTHYEWVDGEAVEMAQIDREHDQIQGFLNALLRQWVEVKRYGWVFSEPFHMQAAPDLPGRSPDLIFVATDHESRIERLTLRGPADLVVEIVSPSSRHTDRVTKPSEYERGGVKEYWLTDPMRRHVDFFTLVDGQFAQVMADEDDRLQSKVLPGAWFRDAWFFDRPPMLSVLKEWGIL